MSSDASFMKVQNMFNNMMKDKIIKFFETDIQASKLTLVYNQTMTGPRYFIEELEKIGFESELLIKNDEIDIREISKQEVMKYRKKVLNCLCLYVPILLLIWLVPYTGLNEFMLMFNIW